MQLRTAFYVSMILYTSVLVFVWSFSFKNKEINPIEIQKGSTGIMSFVFSKAAEGLKESFQPENISTMEGTIAEEIDKFRNRISYPAQAIEDGLESECEWSLVVNEEQKASKIKLIRPCRYRIFEEEFNRVIQDWSFNLAEGTILQIPVSFKIK